MYPIEGISPGWELDKAPSTTKTKNQHVAKCYTETVYWIIGIIKLIRMMWADRGSRTGFFVSKNL